VKRAASGKTQNVFIKITGDILGAVVLILALPFVLTGTARFPIIGLVVGIIAGFLGISSFAASDGISEISIGLIIVSVGLVVVSLLCIAGFICSFKPELFKGRHGRDDLN